MTHHYWFFTQVGTASLLMTHHYWFMTGIGITSFLMTHHYWFMTPVMQMTKAFHVDPLRGTLYDLNSLCWIIPWQNRRGQHFCFSKSQECHWQDWYICSVVSFVNQVWHFTLFCHDSSTFKILIQTVFFMNIHDINSDHFSWMFANFIAQGEGKQWCLRFFRTCDHWQTFMV